MQNTSRGYNSGSLIILRNCEQRYGHPSAQFTKHHTMKMYREVEVELHQMKLSHQFHTPTALSLEKHLPVTIVLAGGWVPEPVCMLPEIEPQFLVVKPVTWILYSELLGFFTLSIVRILNNSKKDMTFWKLGLFLSSGEGRHILCWVPLKELTSITSPLVNIQFPKHRVFLLII
jgi:hypothetical protein